MSPRRPKAPDYGPVVAVEVSPIHDDLAWGTVTTPERARLWSTYNRHADGHAEWADDHHTMTLALIRARETATDLNVPLIYRDTRRIVDLSAVVDERGPVPGAFTVELSHCVGHGTGACGTTTQPEPVLCVDGFATLARAVAFARLLWGGSMIEAECVARFHGYTSTTLPTAPEVWENRNTTHWRVGVRTAVEGSPVEWLVGGHPGE